MRSPSPALTHLSTNAVTQLSRSGYCNSGSVNLNSGHCSRGGRLSRAKLSTCPDRIMRAPSFCRERRFRRAVLQGLACDHDLLHLCRALVDTQRADLTVKLLDL